MNLDPPLANLDGPTAPSGAAQQAVPAQHIPAGQPSSGAVSQPPASNPQRSRAPRGPIAPASDASSSGAPALLEVAAAHPMSTDQRRAPNTFIPDSSMLFHVLSTCDSIMQSTDRFLRSAPAWIPIVSQLYISVLWITMILKVYVNSGYGAMYAQLFHDLNENIRVDECLIPGPLVPFFQALGAINGPFEWIGDIVPVIPDFADFWSGSNFAATNQYVRQIPVPAVLLDQLNYFATWTVPANETLYGNFEWYKNIFSVDTPTYNVRHRLGPQTCGSLFCSSTQVDAARSFWNSVLTGNFTRINSTAGQTALTSWPQLLGFVGQNGSTLQLDWFQHVTIVMHKYCQYFNGSVPLRTISPVGIGAVAIQGEPKTDGLVRSWLYPPTTAAFHFKSSRFSPFREIPSSLKIYFSHADHELEMQAEQYAVLTHTNMRWDKNNPTQNNWTQISGAVTHTGDYWTMSSHRISGPVSLKIQYAQVIASRYHQQNANRVD